MRYAVLGFGRSGSHWTSDLLVRIVGLPLINDDIDRWYQLQSVLHTNDVENILDSPIPSDAVMLFCIRKDSFRAIISLEVAQYTDEWYTYSDKTFRPFQLDPTEFLHKVKTHKKSQEDSIRSAQKLSIPHVICEYEKLVASDDRYKYIADLIGFDRGIDHRDVPENPNPRDYSKIITNYDELEKMWRSVQND